MYYSIYLHRMESGISIFYFDSIQMKATETKIFVIGNASFSLPSFVLFEILSETNL